MPPQLSQIQREQIISLHESGYRICDICRVMGISKRTVYIWLRRYAQTHTTEAQKRHKFTRVTTQEQDKAIVEAHSVNPLLSTRVTATHFNVSLQTIRRRLYKTGVRKIDPAKRRVKRPKKMLEVCVDSLESAVNAIRGGADELELCSALVDGGLTPSPGLVKKVLQVVSTQPVKLRTKVNVMLRCRGGDDFLYSEHEIDTMLSDIEIFKEIGADRFVFGALTGSQQVDEPKCLRILTKACPLPVTFHRAFDLCSNAKTAIETIIKLGFDRLLTSGQRPTADDIDAVHLIRSLLATYGSQIDIMPGAGVNVNNARTFIDIGCKIVHSSCKIERPVFKIERRLTVGTSESARIFVTDESTVKKMKAVLKEVSTNEVIKREADSSTETE